MNNNKIVELSLNLIIAYARFSETIAIIQNLIETMSMNHTHGTPPK